jgi:3-oxoadipate enol-lactonase
MSTFLSVNGLTLHYRLEGNARGIPLVFVHALGTDLRIWDEVASRFVDRFRVIRYDLRGHGLSDAPPGPYSHEDDARDLCGLLDTFELESAIVIGISVGGQIAMEFALENAKRVRALVLCDTALKLGTEEFWNERIANVRMRGLSTIAETIVPRWFAGAFAEQQPSAYRGSINMLSRTSPDGYIAMCGALREADFTHRAAAITVPTLVMTGEHDVSAPPPAARALAVALPNARFETIADAGHMTCIEQPIVVAQYIASFLETIHAE